MTRRVVLISKSGPNLSGFKADYSHWQNMVDPEPTWLRWMPHILMWMSLACLAVCAWAQVGKAVGS